MGAVSELFPSFNAIEEIRIGETINPAEFGGVADITTISKAGSNHLHGGVFENFQNSYTNAADFFSHEVNEVKMNNFGIYMGGPVVIPKLYNGHDKTFFFGSFEALAAAQNSDRNRERSDAGHAQRRFVGLSALTEAPPTS